MGTTIDKSELVASGPDDGLNGHHEPGDYGRDGLNGHRSNNGNNPADDGAELSRLADPDSELDFKGQRRKAIKFSHVSKRFILHQERPRSFQDIVTGFLGKGRALRVAPDELRSTNSDFWALRDVNFSIYEGEAIGIIGENGSGKSTSLKMISKILYPTEGSVSVVGKVSALLELGTGFHMDLTGRENIYLNGSLLGLSRHDMDDRYREIVEFSELERFIDTPIKHWSSGMVMRLGFAVAISVDPDILITDEVLAVGDEAFQRKCMEQIARIRRSGKTIIFVSHALEAVRSLCSRAIWLENGVLRADGPASEVIDQYLEHANRRHRERLHTEYIAEHTSAAPAGYEADGPDTPAPSVDEGVVPTAESELERITQPGSRWGSGRALVTGVTFLDANKEPTNVFTTGDKLILRIFYKANERIEHPVFGLAVYAESGQHLTGPNTRFAGFDVPYIEGEGHIDYVVDWLPLLGGVYDVTVAMTNSDGTEMLDHRHRWYNFSVQPNTSLPDRYGTIYIPGHWSQD